ncbi:MAG: hypothetical protein LBV15_05845 [Planctomycetota bacterium]|jgi:hypothetical protein|nr:hypothetical protein [Planctomycetota bacterium]
MSANVNFAVKNYNYNYDSAQLTKALGDKGLDSTAIARALNEIQSGDLTTLESLGLGHLVARPPVALSLPVLFDERSLDSALAKFGDFNMVEVMQALHESAKELRQANREMRHASADSAAAEAMLSADKIRSAALTNMIFGIVSGAINIGMGLASVGMAVKQAASMKGPAVEMKQAKVEMQQVKADVRLSEAQVELRAAKVEAQVKADTVVKTETQVKATNDLKVAQEKFDTQKIAADNAQQKVGELEAKMGQDGVDQAKLRTDMETARSDLAVANKNLSEARAELKTSQEAFKLAGGVEKTPADLKAAQDAKTVADNKVGELTTEVKGLAVKAEKANAELSKSLDKQLAAKKAEVKTLEAADAKNSTPESKAALKTAQNEQSALELKQQNIAKNAAMYKEPTSDAALDGAKARVEAGRAQLDVSGAVGGRYAEAQAKMNDVMTRSQLQSGKIQGLNTAVGGINQALTGVGGYLAAEDQAEGAKHTANAEKARASADESADFQKAFNDMLQSVQSLLKEVLQAQNQANASIYRNM